MLIDTELPKERIYYKRQGKFIHLMWAPNGFFRTDDSEIAFCMKKQIKLLPSISWFSHVTKIQTKKLSLLLIFYFHVILEHLKTFIQTNFRFKRVLCFAIQDAWISRLLRDAAFSWRPGKLLCGLKTSRIFGHFAI